MKSYLKIVLAGINIICLLITLLYPNTGTPYSLLPIIVTSCSWAFMSSEVDITGKTWFAISATAFGILCIFFGTTSQIIPAVDENGDIIFGKYLFQFNDSVAFIAKQEINYLIPAIFGFIMTTFYILIEVITDYLHGKHKRVEAKNFDDLVNGLIYK